MSFRKLALLALTITFALVAQEEEVVSQPAETEELVLNDEQIAQNSNCKECYQIKCQKNCQGKCPCPSKAKCKKEKEERKGAAKKAVERG